MPKHHIFAMKDADVTAQALWTTWPANVLQIIGPGRIEAAGVGDGIVTASYTTPRGYRVDSSVTVSVFPGTGPLRTTGIGGSVWEKGKILGESGIQGAVVDIVDGPVLRRAVTGVPPPPFVGYQSFPGLLAPHQYRIFGLPPGRYRVRVEAEGYLPLERLFTFAETTRWDDGGLGHFELAKR